MWSAMLTLSLVTTAELLHLAACGQNLVCTMQTAGAIDTDATQHHATQQTTSSLNALTSC